ncbi:MAG: MFS transporter, partial [Kordiimonadaceae bacterium]|nr:MFS transporter [Kordiimonadaceae bacterium]
MKIPNIFYGWKIVGTSVLCFSASPGQFLIGAFSLFIIPLELEFGWSRTEIALTTAFFTIVQAVMNPMIGKLIDRHGSKEILIPTALIFGLMLAIIPLIVSETWHLYLIYSILGVIAGGCSAIPYLRFAAAWFNKKRGLAFGLTMSGGGLGYAYTPPLVQYMIDNYGWHSGYYILSAIVVLIAVPLMYLFLFNKPADLNMYPDGNSSPVELKTAINDEKEI